MPVCEKCGKFIKKIHRSAFGNWNGECILFGIGRDSNSDSCDKYDGELIITAEIERKVYRGEYFE